MDETIICQGREVCQAELRMLRDIIQGNPHWSRHRITLHICRQWDWRTHTGQMKTFAARSFIDKLDAKGLLVLPPIRTQHRPGKRCAYRQVTPPEAVPIRASLSAIAPVSVTRIAGRSYEHGCFGHYLSRHHYLGFHGTVGEHLEYLVRDRDGRDLACLLFGSAAWKSAPRDRWIGWSDGERRRHLNFMTNNTRFLILPWVRVPHLASHILGTVMRRLCCDWLEQYGHRVHLVETFVDQERFKGTCYKAANWTLAGQTQGRSRQDRQRTLAVPVKAIFVYPLHKQFRCLLCAS